MHDEKLFRGVLVPILQCNRYIANLFGKSQTPEGEKITADSTESLDPCRNPSESGMRIREE